MADAVSGEPTTRAALTETLKHLARRWFLAHSVYDAGDARLLQPRQTLAWLRGPLTRAELRRAVLAMAAR